MEQVVDELEYLDPFDCIARIDKCVDLVRKVCICRDTDASVIDSLKEARFEILNVILHMRQAEKNAAPIKSKDEIEREMFHAEYEMAQDLKKMENIREEWRIQQKVMAQLQDTFYYKTHLLEVYASHMASQGSALAGLFSKLLSQGDNVVPIAVANEDFRHVLDVMMDYLCSFMKITQIDMPRNDSSEYKYTLSICESLVNLTVHDKGRLLLINEKRAIMLFIRIVEFIPFIPCSKGDTIKITMLKVLQNLTLENEGCHFLQNVKSTTKLLVKCYDNSEYILRLIINIFLNLSKYLQDDSEPFFIRLRDMIEKEKIVCLCRVTDSKIKMSIQRLVANIDKADKHFESIRRMQELTGAKPEDKKSPKKKKTKKKSKTRSKAPCPCPATVCSSTTAKKRGKKPAQVPDGAPIPYKEFAQIAEKSRQGAKKLARMPLTKSKSHGSKPSKKRTPSSGDETDRSKTNSESTITPCTCSSSGATSGQSVSSLGTSSSKVLKGGSKKEGVGTRGSSSCSCISDDKPSGTKTVAKATKTKRSKKPKNLLARVTSTRLTPTSSRSGQRVKSRFKIPKTKGKKERSIKKMIAVRKLASGEQTTTDFLAGQKALPAATATKSSSGRLGTERNADSCTCVAERKSSTGTDVGAKASGAKRESRKRKRSNDSRRSSATCTPSPSSEGKQGWFSEMNAYPKKPQKGARSESESRGKIAKVTTSSVPLTPRSSSVGSKRVRSRVRVHGSEDWKDKKIRNIVMPPKGGKSGTEQADATSCSSTNVGKKRKSSVTIREPLDVKKCNPRDSSREKTVAERKTSDPKAGKDQKSCTCLYKKPKTDELPSVLNVPSLAPNVSSRIKTSRSCTKISKKRQNESEVHKTKSEPQYPDSCACLFKNIPNTIQNILKPIMTMSTILPETKTCTCLYDAKAVAEPVQDQAKASICVDSNKSDVKSSTIESICKCIPKIQADAVKKADDIPPKTDVPDDVCPCYLCKISVDNVAQEKPSEVCSCESKDGNAAQQTATKPATSTCQKTSGSCLAVHKIGEQERPGKPVNTEEKPQQPSGVTKPASNCLAVHKIGEEAKSEKRDADSCTCPPQQPVPQEIAPSCFAVHKVGEDVKSDKQDANMCKCPSDDKTAATDKKQGNVSNCFAVHKVGEEAKPDKQDADGCSCSPEESSQALKPGVEETSCFTVHKIGEDEKSGEGCTCLTKEQPAVEPIQETGSNCFAVHKIGEDTKTVEQQPEAMNSKQDCCSCLDGAKHDVSAGKQPAPRPSTPVKCCPCFDSNEGLTRGTKTTASPFTGTAKNRGIPTPIPSRIGQRSVSAKRNASQSKPDQMQVDRSFCTKGPQNAAQEVAARVSRSETNVQGKGKGKPAAVSGIPGVSVRNRFQLPDAQNAGEMQDDGKCTCMDPAKKVPDSKNDAAIARRGDVAPQPGKSLIPFRIPDRNLRGAAIVRNIAGFRQSSANAAGTRQIIRSRFQVPAKDGVAAVEAPKVGSAAARKAKK